MPSILQRQRDLQKTFGTKSGEKPRENFSEELAWLRSVSHSSDEGIARKIQLFERHRSHCLSVLSSENPGQDKRVHYWVVWAYDLAENGTIRFSDFLAYVDSAIKTKQVPNGDPIKLAFVDWKHFKVSDYLQGVFAREEKEWLTPVEWLSDYFNATDFDSLKPKLAANILYFVYYWCRGRDDEKAVAVGSRALSLGAPIKTDYTEFLLRMNNDPPRPPAGDANPDAMGETVSANPPGG